MNLVLIIVGVVVLFLGFVIGINLFLDDRHGLAMGLFVLALGGTFMMVFGIIQYSDELNVDFHKACIAHGGTKTADIGRDVVCLTDDNRLVTWK